MNLIPIENVWVALTDDYENRAFPEKIGRKMAEFLTKFTKMP